MLNRLQAQTNLEKFYPDGTVKAWADYKDLFLFRVEHPSPLEKDWDPFFSVDKVTGEVRDFSVLENLPEFSKLEWNEIVVRR